MSDLVSILVPAFNAADTIAATLRSALAQSYAAIEIIVVDDGSRDKTAFIVDAIAQQDPRVRLVRQANAGVAAARNTALAQARGPLIAPLDADDLWHPDKIARQVSRLAAADEGTGFVYCWAVDIDEAGRVMNDLFRPDYFEGDVYAALVLANFVSNSSVPLIRRAALEAAGGWDPSLRAQNAQGAEDLKLYLRLAERCRFALAPAVLVGYRHSPATMSRNIRQMCRSYDLVMREARRRQPHLPDALFRWSRSEFHRYVAYLALERNWSASVAWMLRALVDDPMLLTHHRNRGALSAWLRTPARRLLRRIRPLDQALLRTKPPFQPVDFYAWTPTEKPTEPALSEPRRQTLAMLRVIPPIEGVSRRA